MSQLDLFLPRVTTTDTKDKLVLGSEIINYLEVPENGIECEDLGAFVDAIVPWMNQSNFRVSQNGLDIVSQLVERMKTDFRVYFNAVLPPAIDRLGDSKDTVREKAQLVLVKLMLFTTTPQAMFERLTPGFQHKNAKVREELLLLLQNALSDHGAPALQLSRLIPSVVKLLSDPAAPVRDAAFNTIVEIYKHVGERVRSDLQKKHNVPPAKLGPLMTMFDQIRDSGQMMPGATLHPISSEGSRKDPDDEVDRMAVSKSSGSRPATSPAVKRGYSQKAPSSNGDGGFRRVPSISRKTTGSSSTTSGGSGGMDEAMFISSFEEVPKVQVYSSKDVEEQLSKIRDILGSSSTDWEKRVDALKRIRGVLIAGGTSYDELYQQLRLLEPALQLSVQDLRSQVVREGCITIAYLSQQLGHRVDHVCHTLMPYLIELIPNSAKVMSTSGVVAVRFIIQNTHYGRLLAHITGPMASSKSREIRRACCEFLEQLLAVWPTQALEKHVASLQEAVRRGLTDPDSEARTASRRAYWGFADHFKDAADAILNSLDTSQKKMLVGEMSKSSSSNSLTGPPSRGHYGTLGSRSRASSRAGSQENLTRGLSSLSSRRAASGIPQPSPGKSDRAGGDPSGYQAVAAIRSTSAIDLQAAQRAKARAQYANAQRMRVGAQFSLPRPRRPAAQVTPSRVPPPSGLPSAGGIHANSPHHPPLPLSHTPRTPRTRSRAVVTQSQPGSRSGSPSSRLSYATYGVSPGDSYTIGGGSGGGYSRSRRRSGIPRSTGTSREPSPHRHGGNGTPTASRHRTARDAVHGRPLMAHKILLQSREAESALADALATTRAQSGRPYEDRSDESETSSICSERSYDTSSRRDYMSWHGGGSQHTPSPSGRRIRSVWTANSSKDVGDVIASIASTQWSDRKDGLQALQSVLLSNRMLTASELKRVTDIFTKMFMDTHTKVFSIFLDALQELIVQHHSDLLDWLYPLTARLLNKIGADLLGSVVQKINRTLDIVRDRFPRDQQLRCICRFLLDQTQTPNTKVKVATLHHLRALLELMEPSQFTQSADLQLTVAKVISWTSDQKSVEIRNGAKSVIVAMFNVNTAEFTALLSQLSKLYQDSATDIMQQHIRRRTSVDHSAALLRCRSPGSPMSPSNGAPGTFPRSCSGPRSLSRHGSHPDDTENLNPDELYRSLRRTTAEIQNYSFDGVDHPRPAKPSSSVAATSSAAGESIGQVSLALERLTLSSAGGDTLQSAQPSAGPELLTTAGQLELFNAALAELGSPPAAGASAGGGEACTAERRTALLSVCRLAKHGSQQLWEQHFRTLLRLLLDNLRDGAAPVRELVLSALTEMMRRDCVTPLFHPFIELVFLRVLDAQRDAGDREVCRAAEQCAAATACRLPADSVVRVLNPLIQTGDFPVNQAAIKTLTRLIEQSQQEAVVRYLAEVMPSLLKAYDNTESSVRKAAVFCMVTIHTLCGEEAMRPHLSSLNATKMKLLNLYIKRAQAQSAPTTPPCTDPTSPK